MKGKTTFLVASAFVVSGIGLGHAEVILGNSPTLGAEQHRAPKPIVLKMRGKTVLVNKRVDPQPTAKRTKPQRTPKGWQPGGPLRPLYHSAVDEIHLRHFDHAEAICRQGLMLAPGDKAFTELLGQIPQWRRDTTQGKISDLYNDAVSLIHQGKLDDAEALCHQGLGIEPSNGSFKSLLLDIRDLRNDKLQHALLECYRSASTLMSQGHLQEAEAKCQEGLKLQPTDAVLVSLLKRIKDREGAASGG